MFSDSHIQTKVVRCHQFFYSRATLFFVENLRSLVMPKEVQFSHFPNNNMILSAISHLFIVFNFLSNNVLSRSVAVKQPRSQDFFPFLNFPQI